MLSKIRSALVDLSTGILFVLIAFVSARVLLQHRPLAYLCFPLLVTVALAAGFWRARASKLPFLLIGFLASVPVLVVAVYFFSGRNKPFIAFPILTFAFVCLGAALSRLRVGRAVAAVVMVIANVAGVFAGPYFVRLIVASHDVKERPLPFTIHRADGMAVPAASLRGKIVVLDFWATWCVPCQHELPAVQRVYETMKDRPGIAFFAVDGVMTDAPADPADTVARATAYFQRHGLTVPLAWDGGAELEKTFGLRGFPTLLVLDGEGRVRMRHVGFLGSENLEETLAQKIAELQSEAHR